MIAADFQSTGSQAQNILCGLTVTSIMNCLHTFKAQLQLQRQKHLR
jgi:hypothetical protein